MIDKAKGLKGIFTQNLSQPYFAAYSYCRMLLKEDKCACLSIAECNMNLQSWLCIREERRQRVWCCNKREACTGSLPH